MKRRTPILAFLLFLVAAGAFSATANASRAPADAVALYAERFLPFDPAAKVTVEKSSAVLPGFQAYRIRRTGRYEKLNVDRVVFVSRDGKWFSGGDTLENPSGHPVRAEADLGWLAAQLGSLYRTRVKPRLAPERDAAGLKGVALSVETGFFPVKIPGYVSPDGRTFLQGTLWDFRTDPREERHRRMDLSAQRAQGRSDGPLTIVEYADLECGYCRLRGADLDRLLEANAGIVKARRHYKFFPIWLTHAWAMKAASAADCLFRFAGQAMFRFKELVYARQDTLSVSAIDELALTASEASGISQADFLSCYLRDESFERIRRDIEEGYGVGVVSTPTYFVDGTEISWLEDKVMEDYLRTRFPKLKTVPYTTK